MEIWKELDFNMYKIYDYYEGRQLVAECDDYFEMKKAKKQYIEDTDGECDLEVVFVGEEECEC
jgi:hypothetical protein